MDGYLKLIRSAAMDYLLPIMRERDELQLDWLIEALGYKTTDPSHVKDWANDTWGAGAVMYDSRDTEAMMGAVEAGAKVVNPSSIPGSLRGTLNQLRKSSLGLCHTPKIRNTLNRWRQARGRINDH